MPFVIDPDIRQAWTLPSAVYTSRVIHDTLLGEVLGRSWQLVGDTDAVRVPESVQPVTLLPGSLDEPLLLTRDRNDRVHCISNVCTHRGKLVCEHGGKCAALTCAYHGRRFELDGRFRSMPEFEKAAGFPAESDHLRPVAMADLGKFVFAALDPVVGAAALLDPVRQRIGHLPLEQAALDPARSRDYLVNANWALYCDNYLEGFHIPFVHAGLHAALDYGAYRTDLFSHCSLQVGIARGAEDTLPLPSDSPDAGADVAAYYFWLFPNTMLNVYPWGISVNLVLPLAVDRTRVSFRTYVWDATRLDRGAGADLDKVEREDESVVESVQRGVRSRLYDRGRYSPTQERGVHHFHCLLAQALNAAGC